MIYKTQICQNEGSSRSFGHGGGYEGQDPGQVGRVERDGVLMTPVGGGGPGGLEMRLERKEGSLSRVNSCGPFRRLRKAFYHIRSWKDMRND